MLRIALVNMPFANLEMPSLGLMQLKAVVEEQQSGRASVDVHYLNHDFGNYFGLSLYPAIARAALVSNHGFGEWFFRKAAFPDEPDNIEAYLFRFFPIPDPASDAIKNTLLQKRAGVNDFLNSLITKYRLASYDMVGFTSMFSQNLASFAMARMLKEQVPSLITIMGGSNCETPMGEAIAANLEAIDFVFSGPALKSFPEFVRYQLDGDQPKCHSIRGVFSRQNVASARGQAERIGEDLEIGSDIQLDYTPFLRTIQESFPGKEVQTVLLFETSRGCWWGQRAHCTFCGLNSSTMAYRAMSPQKAIEQFNALFAYSGQYSRLMAVDNIMPRNYVNDVFPYLKTPPGTEIFYEVKADLSREEIKLLARAGVSVIQPGIESLSTPVLKLMKKGTTAFQNIQFLKNCLAYGVDPAWNILLGFPGEPQSVYGKYVRDLPSFFHLPPPAKIGQIRFDRYSPYFAKQAAYDLDLKPADFYEYIYPLDASAVTGLAYHFVDDGDGSYIENVFTWEAKLLQLHKRWKKLWSNTPAAAPVLERREWKGAAWIRDSRSGAMEEYQLDAASEQVLSYLDVPRKLEDIAAFFSWAAADAQERMSLLRERRLLFEEEGRLLSLVVIKDEASGIGKEESAANRELAGVCD